MEVARARGAVRVTELARELRVQPNTIRTDLTALQREGLLVRAHGGAIPVSASTPSRPYTETRGANMDRKRRIGQAAARLVGEYLSVFINAGSTTLEMVRRLPRESIPHVTTNSPEIGLALLSLGATRVDLVGGRLLPESQETDGELFQDVLPDLFWDACILGVSALDLTRGVTSFDASIARLERSIIAQSRRVIVLADSSKLGRYSHVRVTPVQGIHTLVTDDGITPMMRAALEQEGVRVLVAGEDTE